LFEVGIHKKRELDVNVSRFEKSIGLIDCCNNEFRNNLNPIVRDFLEREMLMS
jgi:hypothetical protein